jgi:hypothetical protein
LQRLLIHVLYQRSVVSECRRLPYSVLPEQSRTSWLPETKQPSRPVQPGCRCAIAPIPPPLAVHKGASTALCSCDHEDNHITNCISPAKDISHPLFCNTKSAYTPSSPTCRCVNVLSNKPIAISPTTDFHPRYTAGRLSTPLSFTCHDSSTATILDSVYALILFHRHGEFAAYFRYTFVSLAVAIHNTAFSNHAKHALPINPKLLFFARSTSSDTRGPATYGPFITGMGGFRARGG